MSEESREHENLRPIIYVCTDGPLLIRGDIVLIESGGAPVPQARRTIALCRCGASTIKPFCDGSHKLVGFRSEPPSVE